MYIVTFAFDLGDCRAIYVGQIVGTTDTSYLVTYYEPTTNELLSYDLPREEVIGRGYTENNTLRTAPVIEEYAPVIALPATESIAQPIYA